MAYWNGKSWAEHVPGKVVKLGEPQQHFFGPPERPGCVNCGRLADNPATGMVYKLCIMHGGTTSDNPRLQDGFQASVHADDVGALVAAEVKDGYKPFHRQGR